MPDLAGSSEFHTNITLDPSPTLDPHIWSNLQPELVARILAHLPLTSLFHKRLVSKSWDREIYSVQDIRDVSIRQNLRSWLVLFENGGPVNPHKLHAYDPIRIDWHTFTTIPHFATVQKIGGLSLCGAAAGLLVYKISSLKSHFIRFGVFNPITRSWKELPPLLKRRQKPVVNMYWEDSGFEPSTRVGGHYKLVVAGGLEYGLQVVTTEVYDSRTER
ncbi:F-box/kelch-repeat protein At5g15710 [Physcomitrium patens]|uniref:F-box/kelch-repeat protein At5g15710 n=1 Tax=Physcomitrium patens TaxID=3218 RepID=UPI000D15939F|nr:F-box/kelch-repeat protein At5g43190-like [Physcomitrium patens]|eukprot:XP_024386091.1 F-box/kelch-repeat protein At5g43190-like [Physcomitrella patens]